MKTKAFTAAALLLFAVSCTVKPKKIAYGATACHYCKMNIVDVQHAAEIVAKTGKVYMYDSIECMLYDMNRNPSRKVSLYLVMDYNAPDTFTDATQATYLISDSVPSPMGAFLSAFKNEQDALRLKEEKTGALFSWAELKKKFVTASLN